MSTALLPITLLDGRAPGDAALDVQGADEAVVAGGEELVAPARRGAEAHRSHGLAVGVLVWAKGGLASALTGRSRLTIFDLDAPSLNQKRRSLLWGQCGA